MAKQRRLGAGSSTERKGAAVLDHHNAVLAASVMAMRWRLEQATTRIVEAGSALDRGDQDRVIERLLDIEPLVFEVERVLSAVFLLARETRPEASGRS